jgi:hemerythrin-like domain-containing protein
MADTAQRNQSTSSASEPEIMTSTATAVPPQQSQRAFPNGPRTSPRDKMTEQEIVDWKFNRFATGMSGAHEYLENAYLDVYELADCYEERGIPLHKYLYLAQDFINQLTHHHTVEEDFLFPMLAQRVPEFKKGAVHNKSHQIIHEALVEFEELLNGFKNQPETYSADQVRTVLDSFREPLMKHLVEEVTDLGAENMKKYWTLEEFEKLRI